MFLTALDIGSSQIKALVAEIKKDGKLSLISALKISSAGVRKGEIVNPEDATASLRIVLGKIKLLDKSAVKNIFVNINGSNIKCQSSRGLAAVSRADNEISQDDIERVIKASQTIKLMPNRAIIHTLIKEFIIDGISDIREPLGMVGARLEVNSLIVDAFAPNVKTVINCLESVGGASTGLVYNPLAASRAVLTKNQKDLGAALIDIGSGSTGLSVYAEGKLIHTATIPLGSSNITNDLAIGLRCSLRAAELIKIFFGSAQSKGISLKEKITAPLFKEKTGFEIKELDRNLKSVISRRAIAEIVEMRLAEIFEFVNNELRLIKKAGELPAGIIICGGGSKTPEIIDLAKSEFKLPADTGFSQTDELEFSGDLLQNSTEAGKEEEAVAIDDPEWAVAVGLLMLAADQRQKEDSWRTLDRFSKFPIKKILRYFAP